jgi:2-hydroxychromene-2-carboxylate isomerase
MELELWFDFASTYSYVAAMRAEEVAARAGVKVAWRPFLLGPIFTAQLGIEDSPFNVYPVRGRYMWRDLERLCAEHGLPWRRPSAFPRHSVLAARAALTGAGQPWEGEFIRSVFRANFAEDREIAEPGVIAELLSRCGADAAATLEAAASQPVKNALRSRTERAAQLGLFGAPTFVVGDELFFGQDRMEAALRWHARATAAAR